MKNVKMLVSASLLSVACASAVAEPYVGVNYMDGSLEIMDSIDADLPSLVVRAGYNLNDFISAEVRGGFGVGQEDSVAGSGVDFELEDFYSALVVVKAPSHTSVTPYLVAGFTRAEFKASSNWGNDTETENDFTYGIGADVELTETIALNAEWISYISKGDVEFSGPSLGVSMAF